MPTTICVDASLIIRLVLGQGEFDLPAAYDSHYLAFAQMQDAEFWTTDRRLAEKCPLAWVKLVEAD